MPLWGAAPWGAAPCGGAAWATSVCGFGCGLLAGAVGFGAAAAVCVAAGLGFAAAAAGGVGSLLPPSPNHLPTTRRVDSDGDEG